MFMHNHKLYQATVAHFNQRGHNITDMQVLILKKKTCFRWGLKKGERKMCMRNRKLDPATGAHFNQRGNNIADMQVLSLKKNASDGSYRKEREQMFINYFNTNYKGISNIYFPFDTVNSIVCDN